MPNTTPKGRNDGHEMDYSKITDNIYIGSDLCKGGVCLIHGEEFRSLGVKFEINLSRDNNELPPKDMEVGYLWLPVVDGYAPTQTQLDIGTSAMRSAILSGETVYVHCRNGHGRSPTLVAAYLMRYEGNSLEKANKLITVNRPEVHIEDSQRAELSKFAKRYDM
jgi:protein-tyrosine phosphatase